MGLKREIFINDLSALEKGAKKMRRNKGSTHKRGWKRARRRLKKIMSILRALPDD